MGYFLYGTPPESLEIPDRALAHLKLVIIAKLRRGESFTLSTAGGDGAAYGRQTIWLDPAIPLRFIFDEQVGPSINRAWLELLSVSSNSTGGLTMVSEPTQEQARDAIRAARGGPSAASEVAS